MADDEIYHPSDYRTDVLDILRSFSIIAAPESHWTLVYDEKKYEKYLRENIFTHLDVRFDETELIYDIDYQYNFFDHIVESWGTYSKKSFDFHEVQIKGALYFKQMSARKAYEILKHLSIDQGIEHICVIPSDVYAVRFHKDYSLDQFSDSLNEIDDGLTVPLFGYTGAQFEEM